ncbi:SDR family NAD(P)-dependent oxidoreductase [Natronoarchaeum rubrum]|uniref:SDR family NAD(P)-dependent oxidoreductase n=1 Tax=Natronoarchaeum rubrum TaxID=755311 RepID=UPI00211306DA|nr:SDR family NAD(P)-dependent oxidoreductase [Natronoarchaeum rubrum]HMB51548.1 SDR family NAD(P)-dependent oxidoreductase [Natronoarchaeum rubrum]
MRLDDKTVLITGSGTGIGESTALRCAEAGATVVSTDVDADAAEATAVSIRDDDGEATSFELDVTDGDRFHEVVDEVAAERGLDVLVNNAGIGHPPSSVEDTDASVRDYVVDVNINGTWNGCHAALPVMKEQGSGSIINMASVGGMLGFPYQSVYALTKAAVINFTRAVAAEAGPAGVRANAVCPGFVDTQLTEAFFAGREDPEAAREEMIEDYPLRRLGEPEEIADCVAFLASDAASFVTGHALTADGGYSST